MEINKNHKLLLISGLFIVFFCYKFLWSSFLQTGQCIRDLTHSITSETNKKINEAGDFYYTLMIIGQIFVDIQMILFIIYQIFKVQNFFLTAFIGVFYGIRAMFLNIQKFPYPEGIFWDQPGFPPSIGVPYGKTRDFFYSGHTGLMLFSCLFWAEKKQTRFFKYIAIAGFPYIMFLVTATRVHYVIDIFAAIFFTFWIYRFTKTNLIIFDKLFTKGYNLACYILIQIDKFLRSTFKSKYTKNSSTQIVYYEMN